MHAFSQKPKTTQPTASAKSSALRRTHAGQRHDPNPILDLQRTMGNQAQPRSPQRDAEERRAVLTGTAFPPFGHDFARISVRPPKTGAIQTKPEINEPRDESEQEADRVAEHVVRMPEPRATRAFACGGERPECQTEKENQGRQRWQTKHVEAGAPGLTEAPPDVLDALRSTGQPLDSAARAFMEPRFGHDFSRVRVHTGRKAAESSRSIHAQAYTAGHDVVFGAVEYSPGSAEGKELLAHELAHVVQQNGTAPAVRRKKLKSPYRAQIVFVLESSGAVLTCQDVNANGCRTDILRPGMEVTITDEFVGGAWLFAQNLPEAAVKALYGQKWIYVPAKYVAHLPEAKAQPAPAPKGKSETKTDADARVEQLSAAISSSDTEKITALLNEGGLDDALDLVRRLQDIAEAKGRISPAGRLGDDFSLDASDESSLRVAVAAFTIKLSIGDFSGSVSDAYDALNAAAKRLGYFAQSSVDGYLQSHAGEDVKDVVEQRSTEQFGEFVEQYHRIHAAEKDPLGVFQNRLKEKTLEVLAENEAAVKKQRKALGGQESADKAWKRLETVVVPQAIRYAQLGTLEEKLSSLVTHTTKAVKYAEEGKDDSAAVEYAEERGEPSYADWWRANKFPMGGGGANYPPPIEAIRAELEQDRKRLASVQQQRGYIKNRFPLAKALRPALLAKLAKGPARKDAAAVDAFRRSAFLDLEKQVFEAALSAIAQLRDDVEGGGARLYSFTPLVEQVKSELMLGPDQEAKIDAWVKEQKSRTETIQVVTSALSIALLPLMFVPGGQLVAAIVGLLSAAYGADVTGEQYTAAKAGSAGREIVEKSPEEMRWETNLALLDLVLSGLDVGSAVKALAETGRVAKGIASGEEIAGETRRAERAGEKGESSAGKLKEEAPRKPKSREAKAPIPRRSVPGLPGCKVGSLFCPLYYLREEFTELFDRRLKAGFFEYLHRGAEDIEQLRIRRSLRREMTILTGDPMYTQYLREVAEAEWSGPFRKAVADAHRPGVDHRILNVEGRPMRWPLDDLQSPWVIHHDPPLNWTDLSEGPHLWHPMPYRIHDAAHGWWHELERKIRQRVREAGVDILTEDFDIRGLH
jgi:hypothetical protein